MQKLSTPTIKILETDKFNKKKNKLEFIAD